jgi:membrane protein
MTIVKQRFFSLTLVLGTAFLLLVSLIVSTILSGMVHSLGLGWFWNIVNFVLSLGVVACLFALIFKYLPDVKLAWRPVWYGALLTAILFTIGKMLLGLYLGRGSTVSIYGAAGSLAALLIWTDYSGWILFYGAEVTQAIARREEQVIPPKEHAVPMTPQDHIHAGAPLRTTIAQAQAELRHHPSDVAPPIRSEPRRSVTPYTVAGLAAGAVLGGVGVWLTDRKVAGVPRERLNEQLDQRIRDIEHRVAERMRQHRLFRARAVDDYVSHYEAANKPHIPEPVKAFPRNVYRAVKERVV